MNHIEYGEKIKHIAPSAMMNGNGILSSISFSKNLSSIGGYAFSQFLDIFPRLKDVNFEDCDSLSSIGDFAFYNAI